MIELHPAQFELFALSLPAGLAFGNDLPQGAWQTEDAATCGALTQDVANRTFGVLIMRRRLGDLWTVTQRQLGIMNEKTARDLRKSALVSGLPKEPMPPGAKRRTPLWDLKGVTPSKVFAFLMQPSHHVAARVLNQLYLALPKPDINWARDCQTGNFHTRLWEAHLLACFREQGLRVTQDHPSPDFHIANHLGGEAWVEAVTANPETPYDHVNARPSSAPKTRRDRQIGPAAVRFAKTLRSKLMRRYDQLPHVQGKPFAIALADFHAPESMTWSRVALPSYLYGLETKVIQRDGIKLATKEEVKSLLGPHAIPAGLFRSGEHSELSAVIFSQACSIAKLNRVGISAGADPKGYRYVRIGEFFSRRPGALNSIPFSMDIASAEYRKLWYPYDYEPWSAELEVFHNPFARFPIPNELLPEATHWRMVNGEVSCKSFYERSILRSRTLILPRDMPVPTIAQLLSAAEPED